MARLPSSSGDLPIDATAHPGKNGRGTSSLPRLKVLQAPKLNPEEAAAVDRYIAARRRAHAAMAAVDALKPAILQIVSTRQQIARRGALVTPNHSCTCHYSAAVAVMAKSLSEARERERDSGEAKAVVTATVAFEDVRRREAEKRAKATKAR